MRPLLGFRTITAAARRLGVSRHDLAKATRRIELRGEVATRESAVAEIAALNRRMGSGKIRLLGCVTLVDLARELGLSYPTLCGRVDLLRKTSQPITREALLAPRRPGRAKGKRSEARWRGVELECGKLIEQALARQA